MRTALLDALIKADRVGSGIRTAAARGKNHRRRVGAGIRALALGDTSAEGRELLRRKLRELLANGQWSQNPSVGFLEAFDVAVFMKDTAADRRSRTAGTAG